MAPSVPFRALLSLIINSDPDLGQRPCRIEVPEGDERGRNCGISRPTDGSPAPAAWPPMRYFGPGGFFYSRFRETKIKLKIVTYITSIVLPTG
jgi:hypothetical protein